MPAASAPPPAFVFGVDLDGVCGDFYRRIREIAAEWMEVPLARLTPQATYNFPEWKLEAMGGYKALHHFAVTQRQLFSTMRPIPGAAAALRRLSKDGVRIRIITHRLFIPYFHREAVAQTVAWLDHHGFPYWDLCFMKDKAAVGADLYIDDAPENVRSLRAAGHTCIVFSNATNRGLPGPRAATWTTVERLVRAQAGLRARRG